MLRIPTVINSRDNGRNREILFLVKVNVIFISLQMKISPIADEIHIYRNNKGNWLVVTFFYLKEESAFNNVRQ